ncbi:DUF2855 family protein [Streptomyces verrucosisporus]|uniref:DUF2855 family protein n=1 Tax=Streptomyces verrucosisporus TaxID=1695161 RepID=UPI0019D1245D|nr:DUF2855 family protein [Streptomyces verrucosisporus]MBN3933109.1 DUF2855 family protein [Streptomyces verrucosisporus]
MPDQDGWDLLVRRDDLTATEVRPAAPAAPLRPGQVRLAAERFSLTAITATYARLGESELPFFNAFPGPEGHGRVPAWGYARVEQSRHPDVAEGTRCFGFLPLSTHVVLTVSPVAGGFADTAPERDYLHPWYRRYQFAAEPDVLDDHRVLLRPLYPASFALAEFLTSTVPDGTVLVTSASSKTAVGTAALLADWEGITTVGITSSRHLRSVRELGHYDRLLTYEELPRAQVPESAVLVDFTGQAERLSSVYERFGAVLEDALLVGYTHPGARIEPPEGLSDPEPWIFFTPSEEERFAEKEGEESYRSRYRAAEERFVRDAPSWLAVDRRSGPEALAGAYRSLMAGEIPARSGIVVAPR